MSDNLLNIPCTTIKGEQKTLADFPLFCVHADPLN